MKRLELSDELLGYETVAVDRVLRGHPELHDEYRRERHTSPASRHWRPGRMVCSVLVLMYPMPGCPSHLPWTPCFERGGVHDHDPVAERLLGRRSNR